MMKRHGYTPNEHNKRVKALNGVELSFGTKTTVTEVIPEATWSFEETQGLYELILGYGFEPLENGRSYDVLWDGEKYTCVARRSNNGFIFIGDAAVFEEESEQYPFMIGFPPGNDSLEMEVVAFEGTSHTFGVSTIKEEITQIPVKYLQTMHFYADNGGGETSYYLYLDEACTEGVTMAILNTVTPCTATVSIAGETNIMAIQLINRGYGCVMFNAHDGEYEAYAIDHPTFS